MVAKLHRSNAKNNVWLSKMIKALAFYPYPWLRWTIGLISVISYEVGELTLRFSKYPSISIYLMLAKETVGGQNFLLNIREIVVTRCHQYSLVVPRRHPLLPVITYCQPLSPVITRQPSSPVVPRRQLLSPITTSCHPSSPTATRRHLLPTVVTHRHQTKRFHPYFKHLAVVHHFMYDLS